MDRSKTETESQIQRWSTKWSSNYLDFVAIAFVISIISYLIPMAWNLGTIALFIGVAGSASCGFSWLLTRALFRVDACRDAWPKMVVFGLVITSALLTLFANARDISGVQVYALGFVSNVYALLSSSVLLLTMIEVFVGYHADMPKHEKRFRIVFAGGYSVLLAIAVLWLNGTPEESWANQSSDQVKMVCAVLAIGLALYAWQFRCRHSLPRQKRQRRHLTEISSDDRNLAARLVRKLEQEKLYLEPDFKLSNLAKRLGEEPYRVSTCITGVLEFRNFNALINQYRIMAAREALISPDSCDYKILSIALDCGFSSIGPFNRAFKNETGLTPSEFRKLNRVHDSCDV